MECVEVTRVYRDAARALGIPGRPDLLLMDAETLPAGIMERQGFIGAALLVHSLALDAYLRERIAKNGTPVGFVAYTGESFGILTAAVASGSLSVHDGVRIAQAFTPLMLQTAGAQSTDEAFARTIAAYRTDGRFPDGAVLVKEVFQTATKQMTTRTVSHAETLKGLVRHDEGRQRQP